MSESFVRLFSILGELIQVCGILMISLLFIMMYRVLHQPYMRVWAQAWFALFVALFTLHIAFTIPQLKYAQVFYFLGEYIFAYYLWRGLIHFGGGQDLGHTTKPIILAVLALWSIFLATRSGEFGMRFQLHAVLFISCLLPCIYSATKMETSPEERWAKYGVIFSLSLLVVNFSCGLFGVFNGDKVGPYIAVVYVSYQSIFDLSFEALLAFSLIAVAVVSVRAQLQNANNQLRQQRDVMHELAHQDALTGCFNRRLMTRIFSESQGRSGMIAVIDIDQLKPLNDQYGHNMGDVAIKTVADSVKLHIRSNDYLIRSGGDEFVLIAFDMSAQDLEARLSGIKNTLSLGHPDLPRSVSISWGIECFSVDTDIELAFSRADEAMYRQKHRSNQ